MMAIGRVTEKGSLSKQLNIGMVGAGFMGRAHFNVYLRVNQFFDTTYRPALKAVAGSCQGSNGAFGRRWG